MKKNVMMRVASVLLVAVLLTTCAISGTFAKYTTGDAGHDTARVAKWGVTITANGTTFAEAYNDAADAAGTKVVSTEKTDRIQDHSKLINHNEKKAADFEKAAYPGEKDDDTIACNKFAQEVKCRDDDDSVDPVYKPTTKRDNFLILLVILFKGLEVVRTIIELKWNSHSIS